MTTSIAPIPQQRRTRVSNIWMSIFPGLAIMFVVLGFNFLGDGLRDVLDPRIGGSVSDAVTAKSK